MSTQLGIISVKEYTPRIGVRVKVRCHFYVSVAYVHAEMMALNKAITPAQIKRDGPNVDHLSHLRR